MVPEVAFHETAGMPRMLHFSVALSLSVSSTLCTSSSLSTFVFLLLMLSFSIGAGSLCMLCMTLSFARLVSLSSEAWEALP